MLREQRAVLVVCEECEAEAPSGANARAARQVAANAGWEVTLTLRPESEQGWRVGQYREQIRCPRCAGWTVGTAERLIREATGE